MKFVKGRTFCDQIQGPKDTVSGFFSIQENMSCQEMGKQRIDEQHNEYLGESVKKQSVRKSKEGKHDATSPYKKQILSYLLTLPRLGPFPLCNYFEEQDDITNHMRVVLLNWLVDVHLKYKLLPETFFLTVNIIDQYLSVRNIHRSQLQLLGLTALWIAAKYEQTYQVPKLSNLVCVCDKAYSAPQILKMEGTILEECQFNILQPTSLTYFDTLNDRIELEPRDYFLGRYLLEISLFEIQMRKYLPAMMAISTLYFIRKLQNSRESQNNTSKFQLIQEVLQQNSISQDQIKICARQICLLWQKICVGNSCASLKDKFSSKAFMQVSRITINQYTKISSQSKRHLIPE